jgi:titin
LAALPNGNGLVIRDAPNNRIGGTGVGARNIISGNAEYGVEIRGSSATRNLVQGNFIGTDVTGTARSGNGTTAA